MMKQLSPVLAAGRERLSEYWSCKVWLRPLTRGLWGLLVVVRTYLATLITVHGTTSLNVISLTTPGHEIGWQSGSDQQ